MLVKLIQSNKVQQGGLLEVFAFTTFNLRELLILTRFGHITKISSNKPVLKVTFSDSKRDLLIC